MNRDLFPFARSKKGTVMPLVREENKVLVCRRCSKPKDEVRKYGWIFCNECDSYIKLFTVVKEMDINVIGLFDKHRAHYKPCCDARRDLEKCGLI